METPKITVVIRKRPLGKKELARGDQDIVIVKDQASVQLSEIKLKVDLTKYVEQHNFNFDLAFDDTANNEQVYYSAVRPIIEAAFNRARCTCFAYGQTGSGKTFTMLGDMESQVPGLYLMASYDLFTTIQKPEFSHLHITISFYEIYCGKLFDLLNERANLAAQEDAKGNVQIKGLSERKIQNVQQLMQIIQHGQSARVTSANSANSESSRSHALLQINIKNGKQVHGKLSFIDLAGSERGADVRDQDKATRVDGAEINKSLLALKECIRALDLNKNHTPFRGSKLTLVLKDSLVGNCRTVMIGNISPSSANSEHTLNTLRYADRVKELKKPQDQKSGGDQLNRELFLARGGKSTLLEYKPPESDDEEDSYPQGQQGSLQKMGQIQHQNHRNTQQIPPHPQQQQQMLPPAQIHQLNMQRTHSASHNLNMQQPELPNLNLQANHNFSYPTQQQQGQPQQQLAPPQQIRTQKSNSQQGPTQQQQQLLQQQQLQQQQQFQYQQLQQQQQQQLQQQQPQQSQQQQQQQKQPQPQPLPPQMFQYGNYQQANLNQFIQQPNSQQQQDNIVKQQSQPTPQQNSLNTSFTQQSQNNALQQQQQQQFQQQQLLLQQQQQFYNQQLQNYNSQQPLQNIPPLQFQNFSQANSQQQFFQPGELNSNNGQINNLSEDQEVDNLLLDEDPEIDEQGQILMQQQQELVQKILQEEDEMIITHKEHIDDMVNICKNEMILLNSIGENQIPINEYMLKLKKTLELKLLKINEVMLKITNYEALLEQITYIMTDNIHYDPPQFIDPSQLLQESSQFEIPNQNQLCQLYSPIQFRVPPSPNYIGDQGFYDSEMLFDHFPLQRMFDHEQSQSMKKIVVIKASQLKSQQGFQLLHVDTNHMTPTKKSIDLNRRYQSERIEKRSIRCAMYSQKKELESQPQRSQKGLRNLSLKVKDIVIEMRSTSYKDVAERLIQELGQECRHSELENSKDEQNIKRRVYDALNVMIASGVLRKEGKKVLSDVYMCQKGKSKKNEKELRKEELNKLQRSVTEKKKRLSELFTKVLSLHNLVERNQNQTEAQHKFQFPILIFSENPQKTKLTMEQKILKIMSQKKLLMYADLDILVQMEMYLKNPQLIKEMPNNMFQHLVGPISQVCDQQNN